MKNNTNLNKSFKKAMKKTKGNKKLQVLVIIVFAIIYIATNYFNLDGIFDDKTNVGQATGEMEVAFLDVGQGDATYIKVNNYDILVDAGPKSNYEDLLKQLEEKNIDDFEIVMATHPHEDHIGGIVDVFENYDVESFYMPKSTYTTKTFENMIKAVSNEGLKVNIVKEGDIISLGDGAYIEIFSPMYEEYENANNYSPVMKVVYGETSFMMTGDAEYDVELEVVEKYGDRLKSDFLSFGHHGSSTSSSKEFIEAVNPKYGVISLEKDNSYGHPHKETLDIIDNYKIRTFRTDENGQIKVISDGKEFEIISSK